MDEGAGQIDEPTGASNDAPTFTGDGDDTTDEFEVGANWELSWESAGAFQAELIDASGSSRGVIIESAEAGDGGTFVSEEGTFTIEVTADDTWTIEVIDRSGS
jgi:hypothetical protein